MARIFVEIISLLVQFAKTWWWECRDVFWVHAFKCSYWL